jgi:membrane-associated phospholipid phosphatase
MIRSPRSWRARLPHYLGPDLLFLILFLALLLIVRAAYHAPLHFIHGSTWLPVAALAVLLAVAFGLRIRRILDGDRRQRAELVRVALTMVRDWAPLVAIIVVYDNFHDMTSLICPDLLDSRLRSFDEALLGIEPALWAQRLVRPWLTEYMSFAYALFFAFPMMILATLYTRRRLLDFREFGLALSLAYYLGLVGYMLVPAVGPRYAMASELTVPLTGYWLTEPARQAWNSLEQIDRDCFPSLHAAMSSISLVYLWRGRRRSRFDRVALAVCAPLIVSLWASTIYLRYHYLVDVAAGFALALFCVHAAPALVRWYYQEPSPTVTTRACDRAGHRA